jgi:hypothetical protein
MECRICGKELYDKIDFRTVFKMNFKTHIRCDEYLKVESQYECFPILDLMVEYNYFFLFQQDIIGDYIELFTVGKVLKRILCESNWSIILWMSISDFTTLPNTTQYLFWKLGKNEIKFVSLYREM